MPLPRIVFVCVENANRSQMAEAFAKMYGADKVEAYSAGSRPKGVINPKAITAMQEVGYDLSAHTSKGLDDLPEGEFAAVITMGCGDQCPHLRARRREAWQIPDPKDMPPEEFRQVRDLIAQKVQDFLAQAS